MKLLIIASMLSFTVNASIANSWSRFIGCYETIMVDGKQVDPSPIKSQIVDDYSNIYVDAITKEPVAAINIQPFYYVKAEDIYYGDEGSALDNFGTYTTDSGGHHFRFDGQVAYRPQPEYVGTLHSAIDLQAAKDGTIRVIISRTVDETSEFDSSHSYIMKPSTGCN